MLSPCWPSSTSWVSSPPTPPRARATPPWVRSKDLDTQINVNTYISNLYAGIWVVFCILFGFMCFVCQLIIIKRVALTYICLCTVDCTQRIYIYPYRTDRTPSPRHPKLRRLSPPPVGSYTDRQVVQYTSRQSKERRLNLIKKTRGGGVLSVL